MRSSVLLVTAATVATSVSCASLLPPATTAATTAAARSATSAGVAPIVLDGKFDDWTTTPLWVEAPSPSATRTARSLQRAWVTDDSAWWYLSVENLDSASASAMPGTLHLLVDADGDRATGSTVFAMPGVDFAVDLSRTDKVQAGVYGTGAALRTVGATGLAGYQSAYDLNVVAMPTWSSPRLEMRVSRAGTPSGTTRLGTHLRAQLVFAEAGRVTSALPVASYAFRSAPVAAPPAPTVTAIPSVPPGSTRIAHWNVAEGSFRTPARHAKLLAAVTPDVIMLDEVYSTISDSSLTAFFALPELAALGRWQFVLAGTGGRQKTVVATRLNGLRAAESMRRVEYPAGALDSLRQLVPQAFTTVLDSEAASQLSSTGAWIPIDGVETLFVPLDLQSAGFHGSAQDQLRVLQSRAIRAHVLQEQSRRGTRAPLFIAGDFNAVGSYAPLHELLHTLDVDGSDLAIADAMRLGERSVVTWADPRAAQFAPGRLDFTLFSDAVFQRTGGFVFTTIDLTPAFATSRGLSWDMSPTTSDHMIVVTDLKRR